MPESTSVKPDPLKETFLKGYRFIRLPKMWAGEAFTIGYLEIYVLTEVDDKDKIRLYRTTYKLPITDKFMKFAWEGIKRTGRKLEVYDENKLSESIVEWDDDKKKVTMDLIEEFSDDFPTVMDKVLALQQEAIDRGWTLIC